MSNPPEVDVALYLIGDFVPRELGAHFALEPDVAMTKGTGRRHKITGERVGTYQESTWGLSSVNSVSSNVIDEHAKWLIHNGAAAKGLTGESIHAFIEVRMQCGTSCVLPEILLSFARDLNASIGIVARASIVAYPLI